MVCGGVGRQEGKRRGRVKCGEDGGPVCAGRVEWEVGVEVEVGDGVGVGTGLAQVPFKTRAVKGRCGAKNLYKQAGLSCLLKKRNKKTNTSKKNR